MHKEVKAKIKKLIEKYELAVSSGQVGKYTEEETKNAFIKPLFEALGWNFSEKDEVSAEESIISSGRVDYGFYINGRAKFYLEAKKLKADLNSEEFARQAIRYSFNKGVTWAVLTDFESVKVFNAQALSNYLGDKLYFEIKYSEYVERLDQLWLLSRQAFESDLIDKEAERAGKKLQKVPVTELLYKDLNECRKILTEYLGKWNPKVAKDILDEGVQKLLDRLIFIRVAEDRKIEDNILTPMINQWRTNTDRDKPELYESMANKFRELDDIYNSNLFTPHPFEKWEDDGGALEKVIKILHGKSGYYEYDFSVMPADILGSVYENYLGHKLSQSKKGLTLDKTANKRKEQGIYYTPTFIVDYIVRNALKPVLDKCRSINDLKKIKVLDPACGSGSFLIKALEVIAEKYKDFNLRIDEYTKIQIILENLYGVDLDMQAVEIARLNLLINTLEEKGKLPSLDKNIKNGNSLISGTDEELEKYFGKNFRDKKPFNWQEEFPEVFKQGGFDVIVGNPPYVRPEKVNKDERYYYLNSGNFEKTFGRFDLYILFIEKALKLLKSDGYFSFIIPSSFFNQNYAKSLREWLITAFEIKSIMDLSDIKIFTTATIQSAVIVVKRKKPNYEYKVSLNKPKSQPDFESKAGNISIPQNIFSEMPQFMIRTDLNDKILKIIDKIKEKSIPLSDIYYIVIGSVPHDSKTGASKDRLIANKKTKNSQKKYIEGKDMKRYQITWRNIYLDYQPGLMHRPKFPELFENEKLIVRNISTTEGLLATYDRDKFYTNDTVSLCVPWYLLASVKERGVLGSGYQIKNSNDYSPYYLLALINSKLINYYFQKILSSNLHVYPEAIRNLPIYKIVGSVDKEKRENYKNLSFFAHQMSDFNKNLQAEIEKSNKWYRIKSEIEKTDKKIDEEVYRLYSLTSEEITLVEGEKWIQRT